MNRDGEPQRCKDCSGKVFYNPAGLSLENGIIPFDGDGRFFYYCVNDCPGGKCILARDESTLKDMKENGMGLCPCCRDKENEKLEKLLT